LDTDGATEPSGREPEPVAFEPGTEIGRFVVVRQLGAGGMGVVLAAQDPLLDRKVAVKLLEPRALP
jgi:serine/threonine protein kinase